VLNLLPPSVWTLHKLAVMDYDQSAITLNSDWSECCKHIVTRGDIEWPLTHALTITNIVIERTSLSSGNRSKHDGYFYYFDINK
jgi:hypothetical protein